MSRITDIRYIENSERYWVYVDGDYCTSIRARTFPALNLHVGREITCQEVIDLESFHWKHKYGQESWKKEKLRINRVKELIEGRFPRLEAVVIGFGADSDEFLSEHPDSAGVPDLAIRGRDTGKQYCLLEVTGTDSMRGAKYWVRPDKLRYAIDHPQEDVWICLHYGQPDEKFVFLKPDPAAAYQPSEIKIRDSVELFVEFHSDAGEVHSATSFFSHLLSKRETLLENSAK